MSVSISSIDPHLYHWYKGVSAELNHVAEAASDITSIFRNAQKKGYSRVEIHLEFFYEEGSGTIQEGFVQKMKEQYIETGIPAMIHLPYVSLGNDISNKIPAKRNDEVERIKAVIRSISDLKVAGEPFVELMTIHPGTWPFVKAPSPKWDPNGESPPLEMPLVDSLESITRAVYSAFGCDLCLENNFYQRGQAPFCTDTDQLLRIVDTVNQNLRDKDSTDKSHLSINFDLSHYLTANPLENLISDFEKIKNRIKIIGLSDFELVPEYHSDSPGIAHKPLGEGHIFTNNPEVPGGIKVPKDHLDSMKGTLEGYRGTLNLEIFPRLVHLNSSGSDAFYRAVSRSKPIADSLVKQ